MVLSAGSSAGISWPGIPSRGWPVGGGREGRRPDGDQRSRLLGNYLFSVCVFRASASLRVASRSSLLLFSQLHHFYNVYLKMLVVCTILLLNICHSDSC